MKEKYVLLFLISMVSIVSLIGLISLKEEPSYQGRILLKIVTIGNTTEESLNIDGKSALQLLEENHNVKLVENSPNKMITCIDDVCAKGDFWWMFYVNEKRALLSIDKYFPKDGDKITMKYGDEK